MSKDPIFICGHIKSGTSLMISLLDGHSRVFAYPEEIFFLNKLDRLRKTKKNKISNFWDLFFTDGQIMRFFGGIQTGLFGNVDYSRFDGSKYEALCRSAFLEESEIEGNEKEIFEAIIVNYLKVAEIYNVQRWVEKTPLNELRFSTWINWYPKCKFIYMERNPLEVYAAIKKKRKAEEFCYPLSHFLYNYNRSQRIAKKLSVKFSNNFRIVNFDMLVNEKQETMIEIADFLNIDFEDILLSPTKNAEVWNGNSMFRENKSSEVENDNFIDIRISSLSKKEIQVINDLIVKKSLGFNSNLYMLKSDWKRFLKMKILSFSN